jgi:DNA processing protein
MFAGWAAERNVPIISGAAMGCDQAAHRAALRCGGITVAVLGCGPDIDYPRRARALLAEIRERGVVLSECSWKAEPRRWAFARRNRIIAGLARAVLIVEAGLPSGTFNTAGHALSAGRDLLVVPGSIFSPDSRGSNRLIREGAHPVNDVTDLAFELGISGAPGATSSDVVDDRLLAAVLADPMRPDDLARELEMEIVEVSRALGRHQRVGRIAKYRDGRYGPA